MNNSLCPCGSETNLETCCLPIIKGSQTPATAEDLLRARYAAFTLGEVDFLLATHHSRTRADAKREEIVEWSKNSEWYGLKIIQKEAGGENDNNGSIVFCAKYRDFAKDSETGKLSDIQDHWEKSLFERENGQWRLLDAQGVRPMPIRRAGPKVGRNDPCPCGSGKKHKMCCGN
jgi:SEC-C motif domain protein